MWAKLPRNSARVARIIFNRPISANLWPASTNIVRFRPDRTTSSAISADVWPRLLPTPGPLESALVCAVLDSIGCGEREEAGQIPKDGCRLRFDSAPVEEDRDSPLLSPLSSMTPNPFFILLDLVLDFSRELDVLLLAVDAGGSDGGRLDGRLHHTFESP